MQTGHYFPKCCANNGLYKFPHTQLAYRFVGLNFRFGRICVREPCTLGGINPSDKALRRRMSELAAAARTDKQAGGGAAALLLFYAAECGLKAVYLRRYNLKTTAEARAGAASVLEFKHDIDALRRTLNIPASAAGKCPPITLKRTEISITVVLAHEALRYGEKLQDEEELYNWLEKLVNWADGQL